MFRLIFSANICSNKWQTSTGTPYTRVCPVISSITSGEQNGFPTSEIVLREPSWQGKTRIVNSIVTKADGKLKIRTRFNAGENIYHAVIFVTDVLINCKLRFVSFRSVSPRVTNNLALALFRATVDIPSEFLFDFIRKNDTKCLLPSATFRR